MKRDALLVVLVAAVSALAIVVVRQRNEIGDLKKAAAEVTAAKPVVSAAPPVAMPLKEERALSVAPVEPAAAPAPSPATPVPEAVSNAPASTGGAVSNYFSGLANMMKNPQMKEVIRAQQRVMIDQMYGSLSRYLTLTAEQQDALKQLLLDRQMALTDAGLSAMSGSESDRKQAVEDAKDIKADYDQKIQDLLGPQNYQDFQDYEKTVGERMQVQMFKNALPADNALTEQQEFDLISAMYEERKALPPPSLMNNRNPDPSQLTEANIAETLKQMEALQQAYAKRAAAILTPVQLQQFTAWQQQMSAMQAASLKMAAQMFGKKGAQPPPGANPGQASP